MADGERSRNITIHGPGTGLFLAGDHGTQSSTTISADSGTAAVAPFVELMLGIIPQLGLPADQEAGARRALHELQGEAEGDEPSPSRLQQLMGGFVAYLAQAGAPALTAAFMTLAMHVGIAPR
ncbi:hypothetical protein DEJ50_01025 [Streptomyces venezuelae]|uniref:Uncharacterized protein n=2 Tax=Streptomyces venezuelae TaxID=54571 RepID=A0A5P2CW25_STRVZ|nr:hypothetical protein DEJ50_01025 [Streptomyces venezuelae]